MVSVATMDAQRRAESHSFSAVEYDMRVQLAACYRLVAHYGWTELIYNHISARVPGKDEHYLLNPFGFLFEEVTASNLVKVDMDCNIVDKTPHKVHPAGFVLHHAVHAARPDVVCVLHTHTPAGMAISALKCGLLPLTQNAMMFHGKVGYHDFEGLALMTDERQRIADNLGDNAVLILRNHGVLIAASSVSEAFSMMWFLEKAMQAQLYAMAASQELNMPSDQAAQLTAQMAFTQSRVAQFDGGKSPVGKLEWPALLRLLDRVNPGYRD
jgi:ribulose-5-phosphate 4-epimerase/fuculose-1-phosphate aldolase